MENKILAVRFAQRKYALEKYELGQIKQVRTAANKAIKEYLDYAELKKDALFGQGKWTREKGLKYVKQLKKLDGALKQQVTDITTGAGKRTFKDAIKAYEGILSFDGGVGAFNFTDLSPEKLEALVKGIPVGGATLDDWMDRSLDRRVQEKIRNELLTGSLKGENIEQLKKRVRQRYKSFTRNEVDVMVRTHIQSANNHALQKVYAENRHVVHRVRWLGTLDASSCLRCAALDGREYEHNDHPHIPVHPRCRCVLLPVTKTWAEMGLDRDELKKAYRPELQNDGTYKRVQKTYTQRYNAMSAADKRAFVGPGRYDFLNKSKLEFPDLVNERTGDLYLLKDLPKVEELKESLALWSSGFDGFFTSRGITVENGYRGRDGFKYSDGVSIDELNEIKKDLKGAIEAYENRGLKVPVRLQVIDDADTIDSLGHRAKNKIIYNKAFEKKTLKTFRDIDADWEPGEIPGYVIHTRRDVFVHEIAHHLESRMIRKDQARFLKLFEDNPLDNFPSFYSQENVFEFWAESVSAKILGNAADYPSFQKLTPEVSEFIDKILDRWRQPISRYRRADSIGDATEWAVERGVKLEGFTDADLDIVNDYLRALHNSGTKRVKKIHARKTGGRANALSTDADGNILTWDIGLPTNKVGGHRKVDAIDFLPNSLEKYYNKDLNYNMAAIERKLAEPTVIKNNYDVAMHELGHVETLTDAKLPAGFKDWGELNDAYRKWVDSDSVQDFFSGYAAKDYSEALAEAYVLIKRGKYKRGTLPPYLEELLGFERAVVTRKASDDLVEKMVKQVEREETNRQMTKARARVKVARARARKEDFEKKMRERYFKQKDKNHSDTDLFDMIYFEEFKKLPKREAGKIHGMAKAAERAHVEYMKQIAKDYPEMPTMEELAKFYKKKSNLPTVKKMKAEGKRIKEEIAEVERELARIDSLVFRRIPHKYQGNHLEYINTLPTAEAEEMITALRRYEQLNLRHVDLHNEMFAMADKVRRYEAEYFRGKVLPPRGGKIIFNMEDKATKELLSGRHMKELESMYHPNLLEELSAVQARKNADGRSFYRSGAKFTELDGIIDTTVHEYGHHVEYELPGLQKQARDFLKKRAGTEEISKIYKDFDEWGWKDEFFSHYCGKYYEHGSTEIISMGLEQMYKDPARFFTSDPEYFEFIRRIMWGKDGLAHHFAAPKIIEMRKASKKLVEKMVKRVEAEEMARAAKKNRAFEIKEKRRAKKEAEKKKAVIKTNRAIQYEVVGNVSDSFKKKVKAFETMLPGAIDRIFKDEPLKIAVAKRLTDKYPALKGVRPRGWSEGATWDIVEGLHDPNNKVVLIAEKKLNRYSKLSESVPTERSEAVFLHEIGHAVDLKLAQDGEGYASSGLNFRAAMSKDLKEIGRRESRMPESRIDYFKQGGTAGLQEAFAESLAFLSGADEAVDMFYYFPNFYKEFSNLISSL